VIAKAEIPEQVVVMVEILHEGSRDGWNSEKNAVVGVNAENSALNC
jgi:hypothetical protein